MTGYNSKRNMALVKLTDDDDAQGYIAEYEAALLVSYQRGFADGKRSAERKPLTEEEIVDIRRKTKPTHDRAWADTISFARAVEAKLKERNT